MNIKPGGLAWLVDGKITIVTAAFHLARYQLICVFVLFELNCHIGAVPRREKVPVLLRHQHVVFVFLKAEKAVMQAVPVLFS